MPAITNSGALATRDWQQTVGQSGMTPTAFSFLVPVFVIIVFCPFLCIFCIRRRNRNLPQPVPRKVKKPALRRTEAREQLRRVTDVSNVVDLDEKRAGRDGVTEERGQAPVVADSTSVSEQECAICLSTLHAPSPPAPVLLAPSTASTSTTDKAAILPPIPLSDETEPILKLHTCSHTFHAECLVSWFVLRKTTCPICRAPYISKEDMAAYEEEEVAATTPVVEQMAVVEGPGAVSVSNWRYFWAGQSVTGREQGREAVTDVERGQAGPGNARGLRFWRRG